MAPCHAIQVNFIDPLEHINAWLFPLIHQYTGRTINPPPAMKVSKYAPSLALYQKALGNVLYVNSMNIRSQVLEVISCLR